MKMTFRICSAWLLMLYPFVTAWSTTTSWGNIRNVLYMNNGSVIFDHDGVRSGALPPCAQGLPTRWVTNASLPGGKLQASALMAAKALNKKIYVIGTGACEIWGDTETVNYFSVEE
jgi:hypothetical protein